MARGSEESRQRVGDMRRPNDVEQCCDVNTREMSEQAQAEEAMSEAQLAQQANLAAHSSRENAQTNALSEISTPGHFNNDRSPSSDSTRTCQ